MLVVRCALLVAGSCCVLRGVIRCVLAVVYDLSLGVCNSWFVVRCVLFAIVVCWESVVCCSSLLAVVCWCLL